MCADDHVDGDDDAEDDDDDDDDDIMMVMMNRQLSIFTRRRFARCLLHSNRLSCSPYMDLGGRGRTVPIPQELK